MLTQAKIILTNIGRNFDAAFMADWGINCGKGKLKTIMDYQKSEIKWYMDGKTDQATF